MPLIDTNDPEVWASLYTVYVDGEVCHFERRAKDRIIGPDADNLEAALSSIGLKKEDRIAFIGCGYGWMGERFVELGYKNVVNVDTSSLIHANKDKNAVLPILDIEILTPEGRAELGPCDWVISEDVLPCLSDAECGVFIIAMRQVAPNRVHWVSPKIEGAEQFSAMNWKTAGAWKEFVAPDHLVQRGQKVIS